MNYPHLVWEDDGGVIHETDAAKWKRESQEALQRRNEKNTPWPLSKEPSKKHGDPLRHLITK